MASRHPMYELRNKPNLLVAVNEQQARYVLEAFSLKIEEWGVIHWGASLCGRGFDKIAVIHPGGPLTDREDRWYRELHCRLRTLEAKMYLL